MVLTDHIEYVDMTKTNCSITNIYVYLCMYDVYACCCRLDVLTIEVPDIPLVTTDITDDDAIAASYNEYRYKLKWYILLDYYYVHILCVY
jgi:hypothetical protein